MKALFFLVGFFISITLHAQVNKVSLQASGLTCSMCSNAINKALKSVKFVEDVKADIKTSTFDITFKQGDVIDFDVIKNKVEDAGFFVSKFVANIYFDNVQITPGQPIAVGDKLLQFTGANGTLSGEKAVQVLNKGFVPYKQYKKSSLQPASVGGRQVYFVAI